MSPHYPIEHLFYSQRKQELQRLLLQLRRQHVLALLHEHPSHSKGSSSLSVFWRCASGAQRGVPPPYQSAHDAGVENDQLDIQRDIRAHRGLAEASRLKWSQVLD